MPIGPCPITKTCSPAAMRALRTAFAHIFREPAAVGIESRRQSRLLITRALRKKFPFAVKTIAARNVMKTHHPVAGFELGYACADLYHRASQLVPQYLRRRHKPMMDFLDVRATYPASRHAKQQLAFANFRNRHRFDDDLPLSAIHPRAHMPALGLVRVVRTDMFDGLAHLRRIVRTYDAAAPVRRSNV